MSHDLILYDYWRSSAAYRVRIALNVKGLAYRSIPINLKTGAQKNPEYIALNPHGRVPMLVDGAARLTQSLSIIEYLEELHPTPALLPVDARMRAKARAIALTIAADIHPLNNVGVLRYLTDTLGVSEQAKDGWYEHWILKGLEAVEALARETSNGQFCVGDTITMADCCLIPQLYNARRYSVPLAAFPTLTAIEAHCNGLPAFQKAKPENQPDAE